MTEHPENYEDVTVFGLDEDVEEQLLLAQNECTFIWSNKEGWPVGVIMSYVWRRGSFWLTASSQRARISAVRRDPRVCVVVTSTGSSMARNKTVTWKGECVLHDDQATKDWFYPELSEAILGGPSAQRDAFTLFLDSPAVSSLKSNRPNVLDMTVAKWVKQHPNGWPSRPLKRKQINHE